VSEGKLTVVPEVLVTGGGGAIEGLAATFMRALNGKHEANGESDEPAGRHQKPNELPEKS